MIPEEKSVRTTKGAPGYAIHKKDVAAGIPMNFQKYFYSFDLLEIR